MTRSHPRRIGLILLLITPGPSGMRTARAEDASVHSCGVRALYVLLNIEGHPTTIEAIAACLKTTNPRGSSMRELRDAARSFGLELNGVRLKPGNRSPDRPFLAFVKRGKHGHYLVVRPLGHTGQLIQVIDPNREPEVIDAAELYASPEWTGLALIPDRPNWLTRIAAGLAAGLAMVLLLSLMIPRLRRRSAATEIGGGIAVDTEASPG